MPLDTSDVISEFRLLLKDQETGLNTRFTAIETEQRAIKERLSRGPASLPHADGNATAPLLPTNQDLQTWLKADKGRKASIAVSFPFKMETKAAILNVGGSGLVPG